MGKDDGASMIDGDTDGAMDGTRNPDGTTDGAVFGDTVEFGAMDGFAEGASSRSVSSAGYNLFSQVAINKKLTRRGPFTWRLCGYH